MTRCPSGRSYFDSPAEAQEYIDDLTRGMDILQLPVTPFTPYTCHMCNRLHVAPRSDR